MAERWCDIGPGDRQAVDPGPYRDLADSLDECISLQAPDGRYLHANRNLCAWLGRPEREVLGRGPAQLWPPTLARQEEADLRRALRGEHVERVEQRPRGRDERTVHIHKIPVMDERGTVWAVLGLFRDVTAECRRREQTEQAQRLEAFGRLACGLVHDLNNLLTVIRGNLFLLHQGLDPATQRELLTAMDTAAEQGSELTGRLLALARRQPLPPRPVDLNAVVREVVPLLEHALPHGVSLETRLRSPLPAVLADHGQLAQVLLNLCLNACDAMPRGGRIRVETDEEAALPEEPSGRFVCLRVADTGEGMPPEVRARIFEPFFTTKPPGKGTGLGLAIVAGVVEEHRGRITCTSSPGEGTRFTIALPALPPQESPAPTATGPATRSQTVLVAEDEPGIRSLLQRILQDAGYRVLLATSGREAVELYHRHRPDVDLVLLDYDLPDRSGAEVVDALRAAGAGVRVLLMSGHALIDLPADLTERVDGLLAKPFPTEELLHVVRAALPSR